MGLLRDNQELLKELFESNIIAEIQEETLIEEGRNRHRTLSLGRHGPFNGCNRIPVSV